MNNKHRKTYKLIFCNPVMGTIPWSDIEGLFEALDAVITEGNGSRIRVELNGERAVFHRPHPENSTDKGAVKAVRKFLDNAGIKL